MTSPIYSDYTLEAFVNGSLPREEIQAIEDASQADQTLLERIESLRAQNQAFLERYPVQGAWVEVERRLKASPASQSSSSRLRLAFALGSAVALALVLFPQTKVPPPDDNGIRLKGAVSPSLELNNVRPGAMIDRLQERQIVAAGTTLQLVVRGAINQYVGIFSVDGLEVVTQHYPNEKQAGPVKGERFSLPSSYTLDDAPQFETFILVTSPTEFSVPFTPEQLRMKQTPETLTEFIKASCETCTVTSYTVLKE